MRKRPLLFNTQLFFKIIVLLGFVKIILTTYYIQSDTSQSEVLEYARFEGIEYTDSGDQSKTLPSSIFSPIFPQPPQILIGILYFDLGTTNLRSAFNFSVDSVSTTQVSIKFNKYGSTMIYGTKIQYFAIYDNNIKIYTLTLNFQSTDDIVTQNNKNYPFQLPQNSVKIRNVQCLFTGFDSTYSTLPQDDLTPHGQLNITTTVDSSNTYFTIKTVAPDLSTNLKILYLNCIEYYGAQANDYSMITDVQQKTTTSTIGQVDYAIPLSNSLFKGDQISYFLGMTQMDLSQTGGAIRIEYINPLFSPNRFSFSVKTWSGSTINSARVVFFNHQMIDCKSSSTSSQVNVSDLNKCQSSCPLNYYSLPYKTTTICRPCDPSCSTCSKLNSCTTCPQNSYLSSSTSLCIQCDPNCLTCNNSPTSCTGCQSGYYLYKSACISSKPDGTYCDNKLQCDQCQGLCKDCDSTLLNCNSCFSSQYFLNERCTIIQPPNTYCDPQNICQQCPSTCNGCNSIQQCILCAEPTQFWYQGTCSSTQPDNTYCQENKIQGIQNYCQNCHTSCIQCFGQQYSQCSACQPGFSLIGTSCVCSGLRLGYDQSQLLCIKCSQSGCSDCKADYSKCSLCARSLSLDKVTGKCYCSDLNTYYSIDQQMCLDNSIQYCQVSSKFSNTCDQCIDGYFNYNNLMCSYCEKSKYTNSQNQCVNNCKQDCIICTDGDSCLSNFDNTSGSNINNNGICNYSCSLCNGSSSSNCLTCSSSTRTYNSQNQTCKCKDGYTEIGQIDCEQPVDVASSYEQFELIIFILFVITQIPFVPFYKFNKINIGFGIIQLISLISYDQNLVSILNYSQILSLFQYLSISPLIKQQFFQDSTTNQPHFINQLLLFSFLQMAAFVVYFIQKAIQSPKLNYFNKEILFFINRLTSTINIALLFYTLKLHYQDLNLTQLILLITSSVIQVMLTLFVAKWMYIEYKNYCPFRPRAKAVTSLSLAYPILGGDKFDTLKSQNTLVIFELLFEIRRYINGGVLAFLNQSSISYQIISCIAVLSLFSIIYLKPLDNIKSDLEIMFIELFTSVCFILHSFYIKNNNTSSDKYYLSCSLISLIILQAIAIIGSLHQLIIIVYYKFSQLAQNRVEAFIKKGELIPQVLEKEQIDSILNSKKWDFDFFQGKKNQSRNSTSFSKF